MTDQQPPFGGHQPTPPPYGAQPTPPPGTPFPGPPTQPPYAGQPTPPPGTPFPGQPTPAPMGGGMPPGWYADPSQPGHQRQWDGQQWIGPPVPQGGGGKKKGGFPMWAIPVIACLLLGIVAVIVGAATSSSDDDDKAEVSDTEETTTTEDEEPSTTAEEEEPEPEEPTTTEAEEEEPTTTEAPTTTAAAEPDGSPDAPLPLGATTTVGDYEVTLNATLDANGQVQSENQFNDPPDNGSYAIVDMTVTYRGDEEGTPGFDLSVVMQGGNGVQYKDTECGASLSPGPYDAPTLTDGGSTPVRFCLDYPAEAVAGGSIFVEPLISFDEERAYWALG